MKRLLVLGGVLVGGVIVIRRLLPSARRDPNRRLGATIRRRMMERMIELMPEDSPPKLVMSILPRLREQNDQIITLLREQNELLRERYPGH